MNIQIFGTNKSFDTKKAQRWFKERGIRFQMIDMKEKGMSRGEFDNVCRAVGVLDFREVTFMDSSGIAIVIACVRHMRQLRGEVILRSVPPQPMKVLRASGIERIATLEDERSLVHES